MSLSNASEPTQSSPGSCSVPTTGATGAWTAEQTGNAAAIVAVAMGLGLPPADGAQAARIGVVVAITESTLVSVNFGDYSSNGVMTTSRGLFQQMDGWGPLADRLDPTKAAGMFYHGGAAGQKGLLAVTGWQQMSIAQAGQAVEQSQFSSGSNYATNLAAGTALADQLSGTATCTQGSSNSPPPTGLTQNPSQNPASFGWVRAGPMEPLVFQGHSFGQVAQGTSKLWIAMLTELVPSIPGGLNSNLGCFEDRNNVNNPSVPSFHAYGLACDLNSDVNPNGADPHALSGQGVLPMSTHDIVNKWGFEWGGDFTGTPDPMHIECHLTPQQVTAWASSGSVAP